MRLSDFDYRRIGPGIEIQDNTTDKTVWLQDDDADQVENECDAVWKQAQWKKMGWNRASLLVDDILSNYFE